jgi:ABC-type amino acid transport substrate-binding protein
MRRALLTFGLTSAILFSMANPAGACGDKLLVLGRGIRFQALFGHAASILGYADPGSQAMTVMHDPEFQASVRKAGHKLQLISNVNQLSEALKSGRYDLVLTDMTNAVRLNKEVQTLASRPVVVPIVYGGAKDEIKAAEKQYHCVMKAPNKNSGYLSAIDQALEVEMKQNGTNLQARK